MSAWSWVWVGLLVAQDVEPQPQEVEPAEEVEEGPSLSVGVVDTLVAEARLDNGNGREGDDKFGVFINRLNLSGNTDRVALNTRLDTVLFADTPTSAYANDVRLERVNVELRLDDTFTLIGGDFYRQLGRGILLSLRKVDEVGLDLALRGAEARFSPEGHAVSLFAGAVNPANLDSVSLLVVEDPGDLFAGLSYELSAIENITLGVNGLYAQPSERLLDTLDHTTSGGATIEMYELLEGLTVYGEAALQDRTLAGSTELGKAAYLAADWLIGDSAFLLEAMRLDDFEQRGSRNTALGSRFDYNVPPTLERIDQEVLNSRDVAGARLRAERIFLEGTLATHANAMLRFSDLGETNELLQLHGYAGVEVRFDERTSKAALSGGYRDERMAGESIKTMIHGEVDAVKALVDGWALHLLSNNELRTLLDRRYIRGSTALGAEWGGHGSLTFELGYDTQNPSEDVRRYFFAGILSIDAWDTVRARVTAGTQRGGLKCVAGVCREFPAFAGFRSEIVIRW